MATMQDVRLHIPGKGHVFYADTDAAEMTLDNFRFGDPSTYGDWTWLGDTSSENLVEFEADGGDVTYKRTWDRTQVRAVREDETFTGTVNSVNISRETFELGFAGGEYVEASKKYKIKTTGFAAQKALLIVTEDANDIAGLRLPNVEVKGSFPVFDIEEFMEIPLNLAVLSSSVDQTLFEIFEPRPYVPLTAG